MFVCGYAVGPVSGFWSFTRLDIIVTEARVDGLISPQRDSTVWAVHNLHPDLSHLRSDPGSHCTVQESGRIASSSLPCWLRRFASFGYRRCIARRHVLSGALCYCARYMEYRSDGRPRIRANGGWFCCAVEGLDVDNMGATLALRLNTRDPGCYHARDIITSVSLAWHKQSFQYFTNRDV